MSHQCGLHLNQAEGHVCLCLGSPIMQDAKHTEGMEGVWLKPSSPGPTISQSWSGTDWGRWIPGADGQAYTEAQWDQSSTESKDPDIRSISHSLSEWLPGLPRLALSLLVLPQPSFQTCSCTPSRDRQICSHFRKQLLQWDLPSLCPEGHDEQHAIKSLSCWSPTVSFESQMLSPVPFYQWGNQGPESLCSLADISQPAGSRPGTGAPLCPLTGCSVSTSFRRRRRHHTVNQKMICTGTGPLSSPSSQANVLFLTNQLLWINLRSLRGSVLFRFLEHWPLCHIEHRAPFPATVHSNWRLGLLI